MLAFVSALYNGASWKVVAEKVEAKEHPFTGSTCMMEGKTNGLEAFITTLRRKRGGEGNEEEAATHEPDPHAKCQSIVSGIPLAEPEPAPTQKCERNGEQISRTRTRVHDHHGRSE